MSKDSKLEKWLIENNWCSMPFHHINIDTNGNALTCCKGDPIINKETDQPLNIKDMSLEEIWNHPDRIEIEDYFVKGKRHPACWKCWRENDQKYANRIKFSMMEGNKRLSQMVMDSPGYRPRNKRPKSLEIRPGNICNLKCRICTYWASTSWAKDAHALWYQHIPNYKDTPIAKYNREAQWFDEDRIWEDAETLKDVEFIHFLGGEPMMAHKHFTLLDKVSKIADPKNIHVKYNTNATIMPTMEQIEILQRFKQVSVGCSIDDMGPRFEYQRKNGNWEEVVKNIDTFLTFTKHIYIDCTVSVLNGYYIDEFFNWCDDRGWQNKPDPDHFVAQPGLDLRSLSPKEKEFFLKKLQTGTNYRTKYVIDYMMNEDRYNDEAQDMRYKFIKHCDEIRSENFFDVCPDLKGVMNLEPTWKK